MINISKYSFIIKTIEIFKRLLKYLDFNPIKILYLEENKAINLITNLLVGFLIIYLKVNYYDKNY